jgi:hypothetical protein
MNNLKINDLWINFQERVDGLPLLLTYGHAASLLSCSKAQIQRGIQQGDLAVSKTPGGKSKRSKRITTASVIAWMQKYSD